MKTEITTKYTFEEGDVIVNYMYNWVAIRVAGDAGWKHSNIDESGRYFTDEFVTKLLTIDTWYYAGNRVEQERRDKGESW